MSVTSLLNCPLFSSRSPCHPTVILAPRDCSDYNVLETRKNGVYRVTPDARNGTFEVFCDMESYGGGWTVIQQRLNGSVSFNRTWTEYKKGFGNLRYWISIFPRLLCDRSLVMFSTGGKDLLEPKPVIKTMLSTEPKSKLIFHNCLDNKTPSKHRSIHL